MSRMSRSLEVGQVLSISKRESSSPAQFIRLLKRILIVVYLVAVLFSAIVVPMFRESILRAVKEWLRVAG